MHTQSIVSLASLAIAAPAFAQTRTTEHHVLESVPGFTRPGGEERSAIILSTGTGYPTFPFSVAGIPSGDRPGSPINRVVYMVWGGGRSIWGIGWDVNLQAFGASRRTDISVLITDSTGQGGFILSPGTDNSPGGPTNYTSNGQLLFLADYSIPDVVALADGLIRLEFFESYDDAPGEYEGQWISGNLYFPAIPTQSSASLLALAGVALLNRKRR